MAEATKKDEETNGKKPISSPHSLRDAYMDEVATALAYKDVKKSLLLLFGIEKIYPTQERIIREIAFEKTRRIAATAYTRYGKTFSVGLGLALLLVRTAGHLRVAVIAPQGDQFKEVRREFTKAVLACPVLSESLDTKRGKGAEDLRKQVSANKLTFENGQKEVEFYTSRAQSGSGGKGTAGSGAGSGLMGKGADVVVVDESVQVDSEIMNNYIMRMLETPEARLIELANPWHKEGHFFKHWTNKAYKTFHVGWETGVAEGRHPKSYFDEKRDDCTDLTWQVLYESTFPDHVEQGLINYSLLETARDTKAPEDYEEWRRVYGFDVAGEGKDEAVLYETYQRESDGLVVVSNVWNRKTSPDPMTLVGWARQYIKELSDDVCVDAIGIGEGVYGRLNELGYSSRKVKVGEGASNRKHLFLNKKAQYFWDLRELFFDKRIIFLPDTLPPTAVHELTHLRYEHTSNGKIRIIDPQSGSPDYADALMLTRASQGIIL